MLLHSDMGFPEKDRPEPMRWPISPPRTPLRSIHTRPSESAGGGGEEEEEEEWSTAVTPTAKEAKIPEQLRCPPAPRKRKPPARCQRSSRVEFFSCPPDLEAVFVRRPPEEAK